MEKGTQELQKKALTVARIYFQSHLKNDTAAKYIESRGLSSASLRAFEIGYAPELWRGLVDHFSSHKVRLAAKDAGLLTTPAMPNRLLDFFRNRLVFPIRDHAGELVGYGGRTLSQDKETPKYINTPETDLFNKSALLYGLHQNLDTVTTTGHAILVEGYMDVVSLHAAGCHNAVAPMGTAVTSEQLQLLTGVGVKTLWLCLDGDSAGQKAAERSLSVIMESYHPGLDVRIITLPDKHDPDSLVRESGLDAFKGLMREAKRMADFIDEVCRLDRPCESIEEKAAYMLRLKPYLETAAGSLKDALLERASSLTGLSTAELSESSGLHKHEEQVSSWHPLIVLASRRLMYADNQEPLIEQLKQHSIKGHGYSELVELCEEIESADCEPSSLLARYALAHGKLTDQENTELDRAFGPWAKNVAVSQSLEELRRAPFDEQPKRQIRTALRMN